MPTTNYDRRKSQLNLSAGYRLGPSPIPSSGHHHPDPEEVVSIRSRTAVRVGPCVDQVVGFADDDAHWLKRMRFPQERHYGAV